MSKSSPLCAGGDLSEDHSQAIAALNVPGAFTGKVNTNANNGRTTEEIVQMWNEEHPMDVIIYTPETEPQPFEVASSAACKKDGSTPTGSSRPSYWP